MGNSNCLVQVEPWTGVLPAAMDARSAVQARAASK
jgi:hypothetical protein